MDPKSSYRDEHLHRLHDGELDADERARVEGALDAEGRAKLDALGDLRALLRNAYAAEAQAAPAVDLWAAIDAGIGAQTPAARAAPEPGKVIPFGARAKSAARRPATWFAVAAAAAAALWLAAPRTPGPVETALAPTVPAGVAVDEVEAVGASVTVLEVDDDEGDGPTMIVWLSEDDDPGEPSGHDVADDFIGPPVPEDFDESDEVIQ